jgi:hypothetical protein
MTRKERRKLARERRKAKALRLYNRDKALATKRALTDRKPQSVDDRYWIGLGSRIWTGVSHPVASQKHCEGKQTVTVFGRDMKVTGRTIGLAKRG